MGVHGEFHEGGDILDVCLFKEAESAGDAEGNASSCELQLNLHRVVMGAVEDGDFAEINPLVVKLQHTLGNEGGLLVVGGQGYQGRFCHRGLAHGAEFLGELTRIVPDGGVGKVQYLRDAPVVGLDLVNDGFGITFREFQNVGEVGSPP